VSETWPFTLGVEEEYLVVDASSHELRPRAERILRRAQEILGETVEPELIPSQVEIGTPICQSLGDVRSNLERLRSGVMRAAAEHESRIAAMGTHPIADWLGQGITHKERYEALDEAYQQLAREQLICGCHVHVAVPDPDIAIRIMDRSRPWLPALLALSANSPFWEGVDTGYASYRTMVFDRWPTTGTPLVLGDRAAFDELISSLVKVGAITDASNVYWDIRPSCRYQTLEFRIADVCMTVDQAVMIAGLARALVRTLHREVMADERLTEVRHELIRVGRWRAARYGLEGILVDTLACEEVPGSELARRLLAECRDDLEEHDEWDEISALVEAAIGGGNGASRQRGVFDRRGSLDDVIDDAVRATAADAG
jgi:glutamate---cysteine ligase / carboxylate-amine ligase